MSSAIPATPVSYKEANAWSMATLEAIATCHIAWACANNRTSGQPRVWQEKRCLNVMGIRNNHENDFNNGQYNDILICWMPGVKETFIVTCDPATMRDGRAHLRQGAWNSYVVRPHHWESMDYKPFGGPRQRWALCQDKNEVEVVRTDGKGAAKTTERGRFGINIHDPFKPGADTSIGCTVIQSMETYCKYFVPLLVDKANKQILQNYDDITYLLINHDQLRTYLKQPNPQP